ncbi:polysaccharide pyruvyl transferase family protein [Niabella drilacis]|uniref:Polysaccharide pyruvyl transferase n=1 Tax=Niabella drilacis (strain DSM 25811 / CCM 8410 / CCUG 62505 / LMG 26954 / E90) TaxID=1285928 RepID=A0A1G6LLJ8_NIADE|nr:polysaccharide pyruvyl transferase family protein [Niabella drilacis]SDC44133.1 Polysaccharide pyruvyl transferase [Niabella drilacis]
MKIGILTLPLHGNYGGNLQAFALMSYLKHMGHEPVLVNLVSEAPGSKTLQSQVKQLVRSGIGSIPFLGKRILSSRNVYKHSEHFIGKYIRPRTCSVKGKDDFEILRKYELDGYIVGSDQVWRKEYAKTYISSYFLDFIRDETKLRIAYAASFGVDAWQFDPTLTSDLKMLIHKFDMVAVREDSAVALCKQYFDVKAEHVIDPTMLIKKEEYGALIAREQVPQSKGDCMVYILDDSEDKKKLVDKIAVDGGFRCFTVNAQTQNRKAPIRQRRYPPVASWLRGFMDAKFVVTDSFHGTAFSILFNKPFIVVGNKERGLARFASIARMFDLEHRMLASVGEYDASLLNQTIDWQKVNGRLEMYREKAARMLGTYLK